MQQSKVFLCRCSYHTEVCCNFGVSKSNTYILKGKFKLVDSAYVSITGYLECQPFHDIAEKGCNFLLVRQAKLNSLHCAYALISDDSIGISVVSLEI